MTRQPLQIRLPWPVNDDVALDLIQPAGFLPDINEEMTRIIDSNVFTHVSAQALLTPMTGQAALLIHI